MNIIEKKNNFNNINSDIKNEWCSDLTKKKLNEYDLDNLFYLDLENLLKNLDNEKELNKNIEIINDKIDNLKNFINKITKEKYEYLYKYIYEIEKIKKKQINKNEENDIIDIYEKYVIQYKQLKENKKKLLSLINNNKYFNEIEKILKLYSIIDSELEKISNEIKGNTEDIEIFNLFKEEKEKDVNDENDIYKKNTLYYRNSLLYKINLKKFIKKIIKLNNLYNFLINNKLSKICINELKIKKIIYYKNILLNIFIYYLSNNFYEDKYYGEKVKYSLKLFHFLQIEKECLNKICVNKIKDANIHIIKIKKKENIKQNFLEIIKKCKIYIDQMNYINEIIKNNYYMKYDDELEELFNVDNIICENYLIDIYKDFYIPYTKLLIQNKINEYIKKEDILYVINLIEEFLDILKNTYNFEINANDVFVNLFKKEYEEITFNSINKLTNLVDLLFGQKNKNHINNTNLNEININNNFVNTNNLKCFDEFEYNSFPTDYDIKNFVNVLYKELYNYIFYPYIFRKIITSCNNSLLLLSNNLNNLKQKINFKIDIDINKNNIHCDFIYKKFYYNIELFLISKKILKFLIYNLSKLTDRINEIKCSTYKYYELSFNNQENKNLSKHVVNSRDIDNINYIDDTDVIKFSFNESYENFINFHDYLNCVNLNNLLYEKLLYVKKEETEKKDIDLEMNAISNIKFISFELSKKFILFDEEKDENIEINNFFVKGKNEKKKIFNLIELEKGICELNNSGNSFIYESFEIAEKKLINFIKENYNNLNQNSIYYIFDQFCVSFYNIIVEKIPYNEIKKILNNFINKILLSLISYSSFYIISNMEILIFKYYESLLKLINKQISFSLNYEYKLCSLFKKSIDIKNQKETYNNIPFYFIPITFIILYGGQNITNYLNITEENFINFMIEYLKKPLQKKIKKENTNNCLKNMLNIYAKNMLFKNVN